MNWKRAIVDLLHDKQYWRELWSDLWKQMLLSFVVSLSMNVLILFILGRT